MSKKTSCFFFFWGGRGERGGWVWLGWSPLQRLGFWKEWSSYLLWYGLGWWFGPSLGRGEIWRVWMVVGNLVEDDESWGISEISFPPCCTSLPGFFGPTTTKQPFHSYSIQHLQHISTPPLALADSQSISFVSKVQNPDIPWMPDCFIGIRDPYVMADYFSPKKLGRISSPIFPAVILLMLQKSSDHQLRERWFYPIIHDGFFWHPNGGWPWDFWTIKGPQLVTTRGLAFEFDCICDGVDFTQRAWKNLEPLKGGLTGREVTFLKHPLLLVWDAFENKWH